MGVFIIDGMKDNKFVQEHKTYIQNFLTVLFYYIFACLFFCNVEGWTIIQASKPAHFPCSRPCPRAAVRAHASRPRAKLRAARSWI